MKDDADILLKRALRCSDTPDGELVEKVKNKFIEEEPVVKKMRYSFSTAVIVIALVLLCATAVFAAWRLLTPHEVAEKFEDHTLSAAFDSESAININETVTSGDYTFTLLAVVRGGDMTDMPYYSANVQDDRMYAVAAIQNADGSPMPRAQDEEYGQTPFFATPLVRGQNPGLVNAVTMHGAYTETVVDGVMYRLVTCDDMSIFADRGLYFAICSDVFCDAHTFLWDEQTGEISVNPDYEGASAVFDLPLDPSLADPERAEQFLKDMFQPEESELCDIPDMDWWEDVNWDKAVPVESTVKELAVDEEGFINFSWDTEEYGSGTVRRPYAHIFTDDQTAQSGVGDYMRSEGPDGTKLYAVRFSKDKDGTITGMLVVPETVAYVPVD